MWSPGKQPCDCMDELVTLGTGDSPVLAFLVRACISPVAGECVGGESFPFRASSAYSAVSGQLCCRLTSHTGS